MPRAFTLAAVPGEKARERATMDRPRVLLPAILSGLGLGVSGGSLGFVFSVLMLKMSLIPPQDSLAGFVLSMTFGCVLGMYGWLMIVKKLNRRAKP